MAVYGIVPLNAPFPTAWNFPFQPAAGIHNSILISESLDGFSVAATRQKAREALSGAVPPAVGAKDPASTSTARVIVAPAKLNEARASHDDFAVGPPKARPLERSEAFGVPASDGGRGPRRAYSARWGGGGGSGGAKPPGLLDRCAFITPAISTAQKVATMNLMEWTALRILPNRRLAGS
jgi:hypothetical protein